MKRLWSKILSVALALTLMIGFVPVYAGAQETAQAQDSAGSQAKLADGTYLIDAIMRHANNRQDSMGNAALKKPVTLVVEGGTAKLEMEFVSLTIATGGTPLTGYLGKLGYLPDYEGMAIPGNDATVEPVEVLSYYEDTYDSFNDPANGTDKVMKGKKYPHYMSIPVAFDDSEVWVQVYVPIMEALTAGSGQQYARLQLDWDTVRIKPTISDSVSDALQADLASAEKLLADESQYDAESVKVLKAAIAEAQEVFDRADSTEEALREQSEKLAAAVKKLKKVSKVTLADKTVTYSGSAVSIDAAAVNGTPGAVTYTYYKDANCTQTTTAADGAAANGAAPANAGTYYVRANAAAGGDYAAAQSNVATLKINKANPVMKYSFASLTKKYGTKDFTNELTKITDGNVTFQSSNPSVATVDASGKVTVKGAGSAVITASAAEGTNYGAQTTSFRLSVTPGKAKISSAKNTKKGVITVKWKKGTAVGETTAKVKYKVQYSTSKKFTKKTTKTLTVSAKKKNVQVKKLKKGRTYYVRMRAYHSALKKYGAYSAVKAVKINK